MPERFYPNEENLDKNCEFWDPNGRFYGCNYPNAKMEGRTSCEGIVDEICLYLKDGRSPMYTVIAPDELRNLKVRPPKRGQKPNIPPGETSE